ncbi:hypothetical protein [Tenacibaculum ovolyticum]|uniref:hypothetical protein n=1 Tax=Tenacibaculum ovolyticum TaxID=104270 RepID=UPI003BAA7363
MNIKNVLIIIGQIIVVSLTLFSGIFLLYLEIPGNGALCDAEQIMLVGTWTFFIPLAFGIIINSWIFHKKGKWKNYRISIILVTSILLFFSISLREIIMATYYGKEKNVIEAEIPVFIKIQLFENGKFFAYTYDISCESENTGTYNLTDNKLNLNYKNEKSKYLGTEYKIENNNVNCLNCEQNSELKIK